MFVPGGRVTECLITVRNLLARVSIRIMQNKSGALGWTPNAPLLDRYEPRGRYFDLQVFVAASHVWLDLQSAGPVGFIVVCAIAESE
jgi:hypothetical protein